MRKPRNYDEFGPWWRAEFWRIAAQFYSLMRAGIYWNWLRLTEVFKRRAA